MNKQKIRRITFTALFTALSFVLMLLQMPALFMPSFVEFDFSELPALMAGFVCGPIEGVLVCLLKNILHLPLTSTGCVGELANFLIGAPFVFTASLVFSAEKTRKRAVIGCLIGCLVMAAVSFPVNLFIAYPVYENFIPIEKIIEMYSDILPVKTLPQALIVFNAPFSFVKGALDSAICIVLYKYTEPIYNKKH